MAGEVQLEALLMPFSELSPSPDCMELESLTVDARFDSSSAAFGDLALGLSPADLAIVSISSNVRSLSLMWTRLRRP